MTPQAPPRDKSALQAIFAQVAAEVAVEHALRAAEWHAANDVEKLCQEMAAKNAPKVES